MNSAQMAVAARRRGDQVHIVTLVMSRYEAERIMDELHQIKAEQNTPFANLRKVIRDAADGCLFTGPVQINNIQGL